MNVDWEKMFKRYVADDAKTPYLVPVDKLNRGQAHNEILLHSVFMTVIFGIIGVASLSDKLPHGNAAIVPLYAFALVWAAITFAILKHPVVGAFVVTAPLAALLYFLVYGFHPRLGTGDKILLVGFVLLWVRYCWRLISITRAYPDMPEPPPPAPPGLPPGAP